MPIHVWHLLPDEVQHQLAHVPKFLEPRPGVPVVARLQAEHIPAVALGLLLAMFGFVVMFEVVADEPLLVRALADLLLAHWTDANQPATYDLGRTDGVAFCLLESAAIERAKEPARLEGKAL